MKYISLIFLGLLLTITSCEFEDQVDPNNPSVNSVLTDATIRELNLLATGLEGSIRNGFGTLVTATGSIARELYLFDADPRNTQDLLGSDGISLDNNSFYLTAPYNSRYRAIKNANILLESLDNTSSVSEAEKQGYRGFANTMKALMYTQVLAMLDDNGIRFDVADPTNLGPFLSKDEAFAAIEDLLNTASGQLDGAGAEFTLVLSDGFAGFDTPATFKAFNRAVLAKAMVYSQQWVKAIDALEDSYLDLTADLKTGPKSVFSLSPGDIVNPVFRAPNQNGDQLIVHNSFITEAEAGDTRVTSKTAPRLNATSQDGLTGTHESRLYANNTASIDIIRNEELILHWAEATAQEDRFTESVDAINVVRNAAGLVDYTGATDQASLLDEVLRQRRYSFFSEGQYMFDLRRNGKLNATFLPIDRPGDIVHDQFPIPLPEL